MHNKLSYKNLIDKALKLRQDTFNAFIEHGEAHLGGSFSMIEMLLALHEEILTSEDKQLNRRRAEKLNLDFDFHGTTDKLQIVKDLCKSEKITLNEVAYIGDDVNCFELLSNVGIAACPENAMKNIKSIPNIIQLSKSGGAGVVRELVEIILS